MKYDKDWYDSLNKPKFQPPVWVFAPIWTVFYIVMFIAFYLVLITHFRLLNVVAYLLFIAQLVVNLHWAPVFFKEHDLRKAFLICALLDVLVFLTMTVFFYISKLAGILFLPYMLWCVFASVLCFEILELNEW